MHPSDDPARLKFLLLAAATDLENGINPLSLSWLEKYKVTPPEGELLCKAFAYSIRYFVARGYS